MSIALRLRLPASYSFAASADASFIAALGRNVVIANTRTLRKVGSSHPVSHPSKACFNANGTLLAVKSTSGRIVVLRPSDSELLFDHANQRDGEGSAVHFSPCGKFLIDGLWSGAIYVREALRANVVDQFQFAGEMITGISPSSNSQIWLVTHRPRTPRGANAGNPAYLTVWDWPLVKPKKTIGPSLANIDSCVLSPDGKRIALVGFDDSISQQILQVLSISGECLLRSPIELGGTGAALRWSADGEFIGSVQKGRIVVYASADLSEAASYPYEYPSDICFASDRSFIAFGTWSFGILERIGTDAANRVGNNF
jgi:WD40 repeat protein